MAAVWLTCQIIKICIKIWARGVCVCVCWYSRFLDIYILYAYDLGRFISISPLGSA